MCWIILKFWKEKDKKERVYEQRIFAGNQEGTGGKGHLAAGFCLYQRRCLCRSPLFWRCNYHPAFGKSGIFGGRYCPAGLEEKGEHCRVWRAEAGISGFCGKYGFHGEPLYRGKKTQETGRLFPGRPDGAATGQGCDGLRKSHSSDV